jgi:peptidoglycan/xylan/chitin deacetylase (PgdA/CDA1 family)
VWFNRSNGANFPPVFRPETFALKATVYSISDLLGLNRLAAAHNRHRPIVLTFHGVTSDPSDTLCNAESLHLHRPLFERLMTHLAANYRVVPLSRIVEWLDGQAPAPERAVAITFDDGFRDVLTDAAPVLKQLGLPATLFVATDFVFKGELLWPDRLSAAFTLTRETRLDLDIGGETTRLAFSSRDERAGACATLTARAKLLTPAERRRLVDDVVDMLGLRPADLETAWEGLRPLEPDELPALRDFGIAVGSHTCTHPILARLSPGEQARELSESRRLLENATGEACDHFAYPNGSPGDFDQQTRQSVMDAGYRCAFTTIKRRVAREDNRFEIPRCTVTHNHMTSSEFSAEVAGLTSALRAVRDRVRPHNETPESQNHVSREDLA